ncbi:MAG: hypothetical protein ACYSTZ_05190 [Planctomycetota bacterium]|jgi:hypothetical protein
MSSRQDRQQVEELKSELKFAEHTYASRIHQREFRLLKLTLIMAILALIAGFMYGRIQVW